ncbi:MAG: 3-oxoadipate enol-lactonase, partial [Acinetobacter sp.]
SLGTKLNMWQAQIDHFQKDHFVICYDTRGHGQSSTPQGPYSIDQLGQDVVNLLDHLKIQKADFCGISMGGLTGQWLAIYRPERFHHVVVCNTAAKIGQEQAWLDRAQLVREQGLKPIAETAALRWFTEPFIQSQATIVASLSNDLAASSAEGYASCCEALAKADLRDQLSQITVPVLIIAGQKDPVTTVIDGQYMLDRIANAQLVEIDASHISNVEKPEEFNQALVHFLAQ